MHLHHIRRHIVSTLTYTQRFITTIFASKVNRSLRIHCWLGQQLATWRLHLTAVTLISQVAILKQKTAPMTLFLTMVLTSTVVTMIPMMTFWDSSPIGSLIRQIFKKGECQTSRRRLDQHTHIQKSTAHSIISSCFGQMRYIHRFVVDEIVSYILLLMIIDYNYLNCARFTPIIGKYLDFHFFHFFSKNIRSHFLSVLSKIIMQLVSSCMICIDMMPTEVFVLRYW